MVIQHSTFNIQHSTSGFGARSPAVMGILNITPDSFSDGGVHFDQSKAVHAALQMEQDGAAIIDIGGESTRPGAEPLAAQVEIDRVLPVIEQIRRRSAVAISIDTRKASVAEEALRAGANIVNDVSAMRYSAGMPAFVARSGAPVILMHMRGEPSTMQQFAAYDDVVTDVARELSAMIEDAVAQGIDRGKILVDPGIGFAKTFDQNLELLARARELTALGPLVIGASRKAFIGHLTGRPAGPDRALGSLAAVAAAQRAGAAIVRVHDVRATVDFLKVWMAIEEKR
ncbi:MAG TPA: dihydropteroate synthase [Thermoanaerobaculia bacterium]|jgi:dihydropteroate synthase|nr:dihydropteroate synthase [Thermoanaerobaculia bacterium]